MKTKIAILAFGLLLTSVYADTYNAEVDFEYLDADGFDIVQLSGSYYFQNVNTQGTAWAEAAFMGKNDNVSALYVNFDRDFDVVGIFGEFYNLSDTNFYSNVGITSTDYDDVLSAELGYFFDKYWLVSLASTSSDGIDPIVLSTKYITKLETGSFINFEAGYNDKLKDLYATGVYYWTPVSSVGLTLSDSNFYDYGLEVEHFFSTQIAARFNYTSTSFDNEIGIGLTARF